MAGALLTNCAYRLPSLAVKNFEDGELTGNNILYSSERQFFLAAAPCSITLEFHEPTLTPTSARGFSRGCWRVGRFGEDPREEVGVGVGVM